jgi:alpha-tubulin suppressor-like RCC1 family protein
VYTWGWNWSGQLGHGDLKDQWVPRLVKSFALIRELKQCKVAAVAAGNEHTLAMMNDGSLYSFGKPACVAFVVD